MKSSIVTSGTRFPALQALYSIKKDKIGIPHLCILLFKYENNMNIFHNVLISTKITLNKQDISKKKPAYPLTGFNKVNL